MYYKIYRWIRLKWSIRQRRKAVSQFEVPTYCYSTKDKQEFIRITLKFLEQNIKVIRYE